MSIWCLFVDFSPDDQIGLFFYVFSALFHVSFAVFEWYPSIYHIAGFLFFSALENLASAYTKTDGDLVWFCSKKCIESVGLQVHTLTLFSKASWQTY